MRMRYLYQIATAVNIDMPTAISCKQPFTWVESRGEIDEVADEQQTQEDEEVEEAAEEPDDERVRAAVGINHRHIT